MRLTETFTITASPRELYPVLLDLDRVVPCMPGASLGEANDRPARDLAVTVRMGPMRFNYEGTIEVIERHDEERRAVLQGKARDTKSQGSATATIGMTVTEHDAGSLVTVEGEIALTGRAAQMGGGLIQDVTRQMVGDMTAALEADMAVRGASPAPASSDLRAGRVFWRLLRARLRRLFRRDDGNR